MRSFPDAQHAIVTVSSQRERVLREILQAEGLGNVLTMTFPELAASLLQYSGNTAFSAGKRMVLFLKALKDLDLPGEWRMYLGTNQGMDTLFDIMDSLRSTSLRAADLAKLKGKPAAVSTLTALMRAYERILEVRNVTDSHDLIERATSEIAAGPAGVADRYLFDCVHDASPNEFRLAVAIAQAGADCVFFCDPTAPPPPRQAAIKQVDRELAALLPGLKQETAARSPGFEYGRSIAEGSVEGTPELLQFNDLTSEYRGLAGRARDLIEREGVPAKDIAFYISNQSAQDDLLLYELQRAGLLTEETKIAPARRAFLREVRLIIGLLAEPDRADLRARIISSGLAADESQLGELLESVLSRRETASLTELVTDALDSFLPVTDEEKREALGRYVKIMQDFEALAGTGACMADLRDFASAIEPLLAKLWTGDDLPSVFITPEHPPLRFYNTVFLPCLLLNTRTGMTFPPGVQQLLSEIKHLLPGPVHLPDPANAQLRERWEAGNAAASAAKVILSFHRQEGGRRIEPAAWLRNRVASARQLSFRADEQPCPPHSSDKTVAEKIPVPATLSVTSIRQYSTCPHRFFLDRILRIALPPNERMKLGSLVHKTLAKFHSPGETDFSLERMALLLNEEAGKQALIPESLEEARALLRDYAADTALGGEQTLATEYPFEIDFAGTCLSGRIDRIVAVPGGVKLIDYKMSGSGKVRKHRNAVVDRLDDVQLPLYILAAREAGMKVACFSYLYLDYEKTGMPAEITLRLDESKAQDAIKKTELVQSLGRIENVVAEILSGKEMYERGENAPCKDSPARCDYAAMCSLMMG